MSPSDPSGAPEEPQDGADDQAPDPADFLAPDQPARPLNRILVVAAVVVLAVIVALGVLTWLSIRDEPVSMDDDQISNVITDFIDYTNQGQNAKAQELLCSGMSVMQILTDSPEASNPTQVEKISGIVVEGDTATAMVTTTTRSTIDAEAGLSVKNTMMMSFRNQAGWKVCTPQ